ncbi:tetratricopeptide repeat protein, partial [bacterium]
MNKFKISAILIAVLVFGLLYFGFKSQALSNKLKEIKPGYEKIRQGEQEFKNKYTGLLNEFEAMKKESEALRQDRDNLLARAKGLLADTSRLKELEEAVKENKKDNEALEKEKQDLENSLFSRGAEIKELRDSLAQISKERDEFKSAYEKSRKDNTIRELRSEISDLQKEKSGQIAKLQKENSDIESDFKQAQKELAQLKDQKSKLGKEVEALSSELKEYKANYAGAQKKNKALEEEIKNMPKKFTELARQNKVLIKGTSQMHYNLGVFYTKNKEYGRAVAEFEKVIEITPDDAYAHFNLGYIYAEYLVNRKRAIENFRHYLRLAKSDDQDVDWVKK